jgi:hypothetical protein
MVLAVLGVIGDDRTVLGASPRLEGVLDSMRAESEPVQSRTQRPKSSNRFDLALVRKQCGLLVSGRDTSRVSLRYTQYSDEYHPIVEGKGGECAWRS